jgi:hypothetical protein
MFGTKFKNPEDWEDLDRETSMMNLRRMKKVFVIVTSVILTTLLFSTAHAKNVIKRIEPEMASSKAVAMALETFDGSFYDIDEVRRVRKKKGNIKKIMDKGMIKLKSGEYVDATSIRYFFVRQKVSSSSVRKFDGAIEKRPNEDE